MATSKAETVEDYLAELTDERRRMLESLRRRIRRALPPGFVETMQHGMISYVVPLSKFPETYNGQPLAVASLASQKNHVSLYLLGVYGDAKLRSWFERAYAASGKKLDMGKSCLRFTELSDVALEVVEQALRRVGVPELIAMHDAVHAKRSPRRTPKPA